MILNCLIFVCGNRKCNLFFLGSKFFGVLKPSLTQSGYLIGFQLNFHCRVFFIVNFLGVLEQHG